LSNTATDNPTQRDQDIMRINKDGRNVWEYSFGYSKRNIVENSIYRFKKIIGSIFCSKTDNRQLTEVMLGVRILHIMNGLGMPNSVRI
jgi:hypothetical protein